MNERREIYRVIRLFVWIVANAIVGVFLIRFFVLDVARVDGMSMQPTKKDGDVLLVYRLGYLFGKPERYDIVQAIAPDSGHIVVKRVIGMPGETVRLKRSAVYITDASGNERELVEPYIEKGNTTITVFGAQTEFMIPSDAYFLLGDNRLGSTDSRVYGPVHRRFITGRAIN